MAVEETRTQTGREWYSWMRTLVVPGKTADTGKYDFGRIGGL